MAVILQICFNPTQQKRCGRSVLDAPEHHRRHQYSENLTAIIGAFCTLGNTTTILYSSNLRLENRNQGRIPQDRFL